MSLDEIKNDFTNNIISKPAFINRMYNEIHKTLYDYAKELKETDISKIEISDFTVTMTFRSSGVRMKCLEFDERIAPLETINFGFYEKNDSDMMLRLMEKDFHILDIGSNFGYYSLLFSQKYPSAKIFAFEPVIKSYNVLQENILLNDSKNIKIYNFGFSSSSGVFDFYYSPSGSGNASMANLSMKDDVEVARCFVSTLDSFVVSNGLSIDFLKCDVEGAELFVFQGGLNSIKKYKPIIFSEILRKWSAKFQYNPNEIIELLKSAGYKCYTVSGNGLKEFLIMDENTIETNFFFLHKEKHMNKIEEFENA